MVIDKPILKHIEVFVKLGDDIVHLPARFRSAGLLDLAIDDIKKVYRGEIWYVRVYDGGSKSFPERYIEPH